MPQEPLDPLAEWLEKALWMESEGEEEGGREKTGAELLREDMAGVGKAGG